MKHQSAYQREACERQILNEFLKYIRDNNLDPHKPGIINRKRDIRRMSRNHHDKLEQSISEEWRVYYNERTETSAEYIILEDNGETDEQIDCYMYGMQVRNTSMYDCSGKWCTTHIHWKRTPAGIVVVHYKSLDV